MELVVTDLASVAQVLRRRARPDVTEEDENTVYLRTHRGVHPPQPRAAQGPDGRGRRVLLPGAQPRGARQGGRVLHRARLPRRTPQRRLHEGHRRLGARRGPARLPLRVLLRRRARRAPRLALRPLHAGRPRAPRPLQPGHPRRAARSGVHARTSASASPRTSRTRRAPSTPRGCAASPPCTTRR